MSKPFVWDYNFAQVLYRLQSLTMQGVEPKELTVIGEHPLWQRNANQAILNNKPLEKK